MTGKHENSGDRWGWIHWLPLMQNEKNEVGHNNVFLRVFDAKCFLFLIVYHEQYFKIVAQVIVVDNYFTGSKDSLSQWIGHPRFELLFDTVSILYASLVIHILNKVP